MATFSGKKIIRANRIVNWFGKRKTLMTCVRYFLELSHCKRSFRKFFFQFENLAGRDVPKEVNKLFENVRL